MNMLGSSCFFVVKATDEAAQLLASYLSQSTAADIIETTLVSVDFDVDISAVIKMDQVITGTVEALADIKVEQKLNPLFMSGRVEDLDELLELQKNGDAIRFIGFDGNPFVIKQTDVKVNDETVITGIAQFHPFELPPYDDIVKSYERTPIN